MTDYITFRSSDYVDANNIVSVTIPIASILTMEVIPYATFDKLSREVFITSKVVIHDVSGEKYTFYLENWEFESNCGYDLIIVNESNKCKKKFENCSGDELYVDWYNETYCSDEPVALSKHKNKESHEESVF